MPYQPRTKKEQAVIAEAKKRLRHMHGWNDEQAHRCLQLTSMYQHVKMTEAGSRLIEDGWDDQWFSQPDRRRRSKVFPDTGLPS